MPGAALPRSRVQMKREDLLARNVMVFLAEAYPQVSSTGKTQTRYSCSFKKNGILKF
jgi:hypothetical protein